jgi:DeoD family purine-nucleoside phosphorylase
MTLHLRAKKGDYADTTLLVGDPGRAKTIGAMFDNTTSVCTNRSLFGYTGTYKNKPVSVQTTGMGCPSAAIVVEELLQLDVKRFIRIGTCGGIGAHIKPLDYVAAMSAAPYDGTTQTYMKNRPLAPYATFKILQTSYEVAKRMGININYTGVASVDVFYNPFPDYVEKLRAQGCNAVEMETSLIYYLANKNNREAASFLLVSDIVGGGEEFTKFVTDKALAKGMDTLIKFVLEVVASL